VKCEHEKGCDPIDWLGECSVAFEDIHIFEILST
jgi:hypothetical protein